MIAMREQLKDRIGLRGEFHATFQRTGIRKTQWGVNVTALFTNVCDERGAQVSDHLWFMFGARMQQLHLKLGDEVRFVATVAPYLKHNPEFDGFEEDGPFRVTDYRLIYPSNMRKLGEATARALPLFD